jgi:Undecaprenyl-phosphate galactose phosphotransferase WbaP
MAVQTSTVISPDAIDHLAPSGSSIETSVETGVNTYSTRIRPSRSQHLATGKNGSLQLAMTILPLLLIDLLTISFALLASSFMLQFFGYSMQPRMIVQGFGVLISYVAIGSLMGLYPATAVSPVLEVRQLVRSCLIACSLVLLLNRLFATLSMQEILIGSIGMVFASLSLPFARAIGRFQLGKYEWWGERAIIIGAGTQGRAIYKFYCQCPNRGLRPMGIVSLGESAAREIDELGDPEIAYIGSVSRVSRLAKRYNLRWGIVAPEGRDSMSMNEVIKLSSDLKNLIVLPSKFLLPSLWSNSRECAGVLGVHVSDHLRSPYAQFLKRAIDLLIASTALILVSPLILAFVVLIKRKSPGPAFYGHERIGREGKKFRVWKLRTMLVDADKVLDQHLEKDSEMRMQWMEDQKLKNDPRIIPVIGHLLRKTSLDELPQLFNVVRGEMSLVGPRPIVTNEIGKYGDMYSMYLRVTPGITGLWQVSGRNDTSYDHRVRLDSYYVCNWSVWLDAYIFIRTFRTIVYREGAY